jgi:hypothetical protein
VGVEDGTGFSTGFITSSVEPLGSASSLLPYWIFIV